MSEQHPDSADKIVYFIEQWLVLCLVFGVYGFLSLRCLHELLWPPQRECGMPVVAALTFQLVSAVVAALIVGAKFYFRGGYSRAVRWIVLLLLLIPVLIALAAY